MERIPEQELMDEAAQALAYAGADFEQPHSMFIGLFCNLFDNVADGAHVLDLGCGRAITSIFLAKEFDLQVWATDLWIGPDNNWRRVQEADLVLLIGHHFEFDLDFGDGVGADAPAQVTRIGLPGVGESQPPAVFEPGGPEAPHLERAVRARLEAYAEAQWEHLFAHRPGNPIYGD